MLLKLFYKRVMKNPGFNFQSTYTELPNIFFSKVKPSIVEKPNLIIFNQELSDELKLNFLGINSEDKASFFSGNLLLPNMKTFSQAYSGHQFGHFTNLGDGRAIMLGEHIISNDKRVDIQLKGAGLTPYSRQGDGKAVLGPMLREYIVSEAMHYLKIPTTRSLSVVKTGEKVHREFPMEGAMLTRVASSHIRVGTFQFALITQNLKNLKNLINYTINRHYPYIKNSKQKYFDLLKILVKKQVELITHWMRVGFIHGVMNTDNMTLSGETIDYGPCAFLDEYKGSKVFSSIDFQGRYSFENQPLMAKWNLARLAETFLPLMQDDIDKNKKKAEKIIQSFSELFNKKWLNMMRNKLGLLKEKKEDQKLISDLLKLMESNSDDYTNTFNDLSDFNNLNKTQYQSFNYKDWIARWKKRLDEENVSTEKSFLLMKKNNPYIIPRNHKLEMIINEANKDNFSPLYEMNKILKTPYKRTEEADKFTLRPRENEKVSKTFCGT